MKIINTFDFAQYAFILLLFLFVFPTPSYAANNAACVSISPPAAPVYEGYKFPVVVTMRNSGDTAWSRTSNYYLGSQDPQDNDKWGGNRVSLPTSSVSAGSTAIFSFDVTIQAAPGTHNFFWKMLQESVEWFGDTTCTASITVLPSPYTLYVPLFVQNHPSGYRSPNSYDSSTQTDLRQWTGVIVDNPNSTAVPVRATIFGYDGKELASTQSAVLAGSGWFDSSFWYQWIPGTVSGVNGNHPQYPSNVGWAKIVPQASSAGESPLPIIGNQKITVNEKVGTTTPSLGSTHLSTDMVLPRGLSTHFNGGYFMRNQNSGYPASLEPTTVSSENVVQKTYMNLVNPNSTQAIVTLKIYKQDGTLHKTLTKTLPAYSSKYSIGDTDWETIPFMETNSQVLQLVGSTFTPNTTEANAPGGTAYKLLNTGSQGANDGTYFASPSGNFTFLNVDLATPGVDVGLVVEYCSGVTSSNCSAWTAVSGKSDGTNNFARDGKISWVDPGNAWVTGTVNGYSGKWLRIRSSTAPTTAPTAYFSSIGRSVGWIDVTSDIPITGFNRLVVENPGDDSDKWLRFMTDMPLLEAPSTTLYTTLFTQNWNSGFTSHSTTPNTYAGQWSYIQLYNPGTSSATATIKVYKRDGTLCSPGCTLTRTIAANGSWYSHGDTGTTNWNNIPYMDTANNKSLGWVEVTSAQPLVGLNRVAFLSKPSDPANFYYWTDFPMQSAGATKSYASYYLNGHSSGYWESADVKQKSYLHIVNPGSTAADITLKILNPTTGATHASRSFSLDSKKSWVAIDDAANWTGISGLTYGWIEATSSAAVVVSNRIMFANTGSSATLTDWVRLMTDTPSAGIPPGLGALNIVPDSADSPAGAPLGTYGTSGLRSTDSGSNYYNSLKITQGLSSNETSANVALVGTAFTSKESGWMPTDNSLYQLTRSAYHENGFVLLYANQAKSANYCSGTQPNACTTASQSFTANKFYVYFKGSWSGAHTPDGTDPCNATPCGTSQGLYVNMTSTPTFPAGPIFSRVRLFKPIGNHNWGTYGYVMDSTSGGETAQSKTPSQ